MANELTFLSQMTLSSPPANYATTSANIINTLPQVQRMNRNIFRQTLTKTEAKIKECFLSKSLFFRCRFPWVSSTTSLRCRHPSHYPCQPHYQQSLLLHSRYLYLYFHCICICISTAFVFVLAADGPEHPRHSVELGVKLADTSPSELLPLSGGCSSNHCT